MVERSGIEEPEPTGWALVRCLVREFVHDVRHPTPLTVRYLRCDGCGQVTPHTRDQRLYTIRAAEREVTAPPPEAVCDECGHARPRTVDDEVPAEVTVACVGHRHRRIRVGRSRRPCGVHRAGRRVARIVPVVLGGPARTGVLSNQGW